MTETFYDASGNPRTALEMVQLEPEWVADRLLNALDDCRALARLEQRVHEQQQRIQELEEALRIGDTCARDCEGAAFRIEYRRGVQRIRELEDVLQSLMDVQNGCPLLKYQATWERAMADGERLLKQKS